MEKYILRVFTGHQTRNSRADRFTTGKAYSYKHSELRNNNVMSYAVLDDNGNKAIAAGKSEYWVEVPSGITMECAQFLYPSYLSNPEALMGMSFSDFAFIAFATTTKQTELRGFDLPSKLRNNVGRVINEWSAFFDNAVDEVFAVRPRAKSEPFSGVGFDFAKLPAFSSDFAERVLQINNETSKLLKTHEGNNTMKHIVIKQVTTINGVESDQYSDEKLLEMIAEQHAILQGLETFKIESRAITTLRSKHAANIINLTEILDARYPEVSVTNTIDSAEILKECLDKMAGLTPHSNSDLI